MKLKCEKCIGEKTSTKYCLKCKKTFCDTIITSKVIEKTSYEAELIDCCPECGSRSIIYIK